LWRIFFLDPIIKKTPRLAAGRRETFTSES